MKMKVGKGLFSGEKNPAWKGGRIYDKDGYVLIWMPDHPNRNNDNYVREHRLVYEKYLGRYLTQQEEIHHINGIKDDNRLQNLNKFLKNEHCRLHHKKDFSKRFCAACKNKTSVVKNGPQKGYEHWYKNPLNKNEWYCANCYRKFRHD